MSDVTCCTYLNPCSNSFAVYEFKRLSCCSKFVTIFCTVIGLAGCGIGALGMYRFCLSKLDDVPPEMRRQYALRAENLGLNTVHVKRAAQEEV